MANLFGGLSTPRYESPTDLAEAASRGNQSFASEFGAAFRQRKSIQAQQNDPLLQLKKAAFQTQLAQHASELADSELSRQIKQKQIDDEMADKLAFTNLFKQYGSNNDQMLDALGKTAFNSTMGRQNATQVRLAIVAERAKDAATKAISKLTPQGMARVSRFEMGTPEFWDAVEQEDAANKPQSTFGKILFDRDAAKKAGDLDQVALYDAAISKYGAKEGLSVQFDDEGRPIINYGQNVTNVGKPTVATQSGSQRKLLKYEAATELINHLQKNMEDSHVGISGLLGENIGDRLLPQFGIDTFKGKRADVRSTMVAARESLLREISDDTRFSNADREEISKALPSSGAFESLPDAQQRLSTVRRIISQRGRVYSESLGLNPPLWSLSKEEIKAMYDQNQADPKKGIDYNTALEALQRFH